MTIKLKLLFIAVLALAVQACQERPFQNEVKQLDSMLMILDSVGEVQAGLDTTGYNQALLKYNKNMASVQGAYTARGDTMDRDVAMMLAEYRGIKRPLERFKGSYVALANDIDFTRNQLLDLKHDIENNLLDSNIVNRLLREENDALTRILMESGQQSLSHRTTREKREEIEPIIDSLLSELTENE